MKKMVFDFFHIKDDYIDYLRKTDSTVQLNKSQKRPYVGVVFEIRGSYFYAPLTSPKDKHRHGNNRLDLRLIDGGKCGAINLNNMVPVPKSALIRLVIKNEPDMKYRKLLAKQHKLILDDKDAILQNAEKIYWLRTKSNDKDLTFAMKKIKERCCDFKKLEIAAKKWRDGKQ